jgi:hypothetical protein
MGILQYPTPIPATVAVLPTLKFMVSTDNLATITTAGYLNSANLDAANPISNTDVIMMLYNYNSATTIGTYGLFSASVSGTVGSITLGLTSIQLTATVTLTAAQVLAMYATPQLIVPAPGTGLALMPTAAQIVTLVGTAAFAGGGAAQLQWGNTNHAGGTVALDATTPAAEITAAASQIYTQYGVPTTTVTPIATANGLGLYFTNATGPFTGGAGSTVTIALSYMVVPV